MASERRPLVYDITRLLSRLVNRTPNGIDRVDAALAQYFVDASRADRSALVFTPLGPQVIAAEAARDAVQAIRENWGEEQTPDEDPHLHEIVARIEGAPSLVHRIAKTRRGRGRAALAWMRRHGFLHGMAPARFLADGGVYLNVSQFPIQFDRLFRWSESRADIDLVFYIHDLLPLEAPEYFKRAEQPRHLSRLQTVARRARAAMVSTHVVREALERHVVGLGRRDLPILVAPPPPDPIFSQAPAGLADLSRRSYFVACGTIEPRKNHLLLLHVWRDLVARMGAEAPKLVILGVRGWENEHVLNLLDRSPALRGHVIEASGLPTPSVHKLMLGAQAVLMPTFAEGYGLPVVEALASGAPVIASDIPVFREIGDNRLLLIDPTDGPKWREAIGAFAANDSDLRREWLSRSRGYVAPNRTSFFANVEDFLTDLKR